MGKLILRLPDGATREIALNRERLTIGRRADNHVCLPYPAVSAEHAAVVTILDDSFLEDLNSTNGTLVNGKRITKHFLRDHDEIDIGRHMLVYFSGDFSSAMVDAALPQAGSETQVASDHSRPLGAPKESVFPVVEGTTLSSVAPESVDSASIDTGAMFRSLTPEPSQQADRDEAPASMPGNAPTLEVLDGPLAGHAVQVDRNEFVIGRVGVQIAAIRTAGDGYRLVQLEGDMQPSINGNALPENGQVLRAGDELVIAGTRIAFHPAS